MSGFDTRGAASTHARRNNTGQVEIDLRTEGGRGESSRSSSRLDRSGQPGRPKYNICTCMCLLDRLAYFR